MELTFGEVLAQETLAQTPVVKVLRGTERGSNLPVLVFVFDPDLESLAVQTWAQSRAMRLRLPVNQIAIIDAQQTAELFFVSVAWNAHTPADIRALPARLAQIVAWLEGSSRDDLGVRVTDVLRALENLEPRSVARTVMLPPEGNHMPTTSSDNLRATSILPASTPRRTTTLTASPVELSEFTGDEVAVPSSRRWLAWGAGLGIAAAAIAGFSVRRTGPTVLLPVAAQQQQKQVQTPDPALRFPSEPSPPAPDTPTAPAAPTPLVNPGLQTVLVSSRPSGATVCDPKTGKILGRTPLNLPSSQFQTGHKLLLTRAGAQFRTFRWPADHTMTLTRLDADEPQPLSPCAF